MGPPWGIKKSGVLDIRMYFHTIGITYKILVGVSKSYSCLMTTQWPCQATSDKQVTGSCWLALQLRMAQFQGGFAERPLLRTEGTGPTYQSMLQQVGVSSSKVYLLLFTHRRLSCFITALDIQLSPLRVPVYVISSSGDMFYLNDPIVNWESCRHFT